MVKETKFYNLLDVSPTATEEEVRKSYIKLALKYHPDRNPNEVEQFVAISQAYDVLSNPDRRRAYDQIGDDSDENGQQAVVVPSGDAGDCNSQMGMCPTQTAEEAPIESEAAQPLPPWRSYNGPKLYVKPKVRNSNQQIIRKAVAKALEGTANANALKKIQDTIDANQGTCGQFLILFRNNQFKGLYEYKSKLDTISKLDGIGPKTVNVENIVRFYKYDLSKRQFIEVETKHIGPTIIAFSLANLKPRQ